MDKKNVLKTLIIFLSAVTVFTGETYGYAEAEQSIRTTVQPSVAIEKSNSSIETNTINATNGQHNGLKSIFTLQTNGNDTNYDFIITSKILSGGELVSAYGQNGCLLFGNILSNPTTSDINDAKAGGNQNKNVIAYPITATVSDTDSKMTVDFSSDYGTYGACYVLKVNEAQEGTVVHSVNQNPFGGTYNIGQDEAGTYQAVVTFTAVSK